MSNVETPLDRGDNFYHNYATRHLGPEHHAEDYQAYSGLPKRHKCNYHIAEWKGLKGTVKRYGMSYNRVEYYVTVHPDGHRTYGYSSQYGEAPRTVRKKVRHRDIEFHFGL